MDINTTIRMEWNGIIGKMWNKVIKLEENLSLQAETLVLIENNVWGSLRMVHIYNTFFSDEKTPQEIWIIFGKETEKTKPSL